jgi:hypothetical protein
MTLSGTAVHEQQDEPPTVLLTHSSRKIWKHLVSDAGGSVCPVPPPFGMRRFRRATLRARRDRYDEPMRRPHKPAPPRAFHEGG